MAEHHSPTRTAPSYTVRVVGAQRQWFRDFYHFFLRLSWVQAFVAIVLGYLATNALFGVGFWLVGGVKNAHTFADAFHFSVQTMGTIGYGAMYPESQAANLLVDLESTVGLIITALATGLVFAKFSQPGGRIAFSRSVVVSPWDGVPTLMFRVGNQRGNMIVEAQLRVSMIRTETTREGVRFYKMIDLPLVRDRSPAVTRSWTVMHVLDEKSPLHGKTPADLARDEIELVVTLAGVDDTSLQPVHARHTYEHDEIRWGARHADILTELPSGDIVLDVRRFHDVVATEPTEGFPYPEARP